MSPKMLGGVYFLWTVLFIFSSAMDNLLVAPGRETLINSMIGGQIESFQGAGVVQLPGLAIGFATALFSIVVWDFPFLSNDVGLLMKVVILYPISLATIVGTLVFVWPVISSKIGIAMGIGAMLAAFTTAIAAAIGL